MLFYVTEAFEVSNTPPDNYYWVVKAFDQESAIATLKDHLNPETPNNSFIEIGLSKLPKKELEKEPVSSSPIYSGSESREDDNKSASSRLMDFISMATGGFSSGDW